MSNDIDLSKPGVMEILRVIRRRLYSHCQELNITDEDVSKSTAEWNKAFGIAKGAYEMLCCFQDAEEDVFSMMLGSMSPEEFRATEPELFSENDDSPPCKD